MQFRDSMSYRPPGAMLSIIPLLKVGIILLHHRLPLTILEAVAAIIVDLPFKIVNAIFFNLVVYFLTNLRREPGAFFFFLLVNFVSILVMCKSTMPICLTKLTCVRSNVLPYYCFRSSKSNAGSGSVSDPPQRSCYLYRICHPDSRYVRLGSVRKPRSSSVEKLTYVHKVDQLHQSSRVCLRSLNGQRISRSRLFLLSLRSFRSVLQRYRRHEPGLFCRRLSSWL